MGISIELTNIKHNGAMCVHYKGDKKDVLEMCRVDYSHSGKMIMKGQVSKTANGLALSFGAPTVSDMEIKLCQSDYCKEKSGIDK